MRETELLVLLAIAGLALLASPILSIVALVRVRRLEERAGGANDELIRTMLQRIFELERRVTRWTEAGARPAEPAPQTAGVAPPSPPPGPPPLTPVSPPPLMPPAPPPRRMDLETIIGGKILNRIGMLALLIAAAFFLKYAFDNDWIGPAGRVAIGLLGGAAIIAYSQWFLRGGFGYFAEGLIGLGAAILYLSLWAGTGMYKLLPVAAGFAAMVLVTAAVMAIAVARDSQRVAVLALIGGFLTPILVSTGRGDYVTLFSYLALLDAGLLVLAHVRAWRVLEFVCFAFTQAYVWAWYADRYRTDDLGPTAAFTTLFFLLFSALPVIRSRRLGMLYKEQSLLVLANAGLYMLMLYNLLWPDQKWLLTLAALGLAAGHLIVAGLIERPAAGGLAPVQVLFAALALGFVALVIPLRLEGRWISIGWAVQAAAMVWAGLALRSRFFRAVGLLLFAVVGWRLIFLSPAGAVDTLFLNQRFLAFAVTVAAMAVAIWSAREVPEALSEGEQRWFGALSVLANILLLAALSYEVYDYFTRAYRDSVDRSALWGRRLGISLLWIAYATGLMWAGVAKGIALLRWQSIALFGATILKVFFSDLDRLAQGYRILAFLVLGVMLMAVSFLYQKKLGAKT